MKFFFRVSAFALIGALLLTMVPAVAQAATVTFLTSGTSYSTPGDWNNSDNSIECIGAGGHGGSTVNLGAAGGGGGAYAKITNLTIAGSITYAIASGGSLANTTFNVTSLICDAGNNASGNTPGTGGLASASTGTTKYDGGDGVIADAGTSGGGGGGAGGTTSAGSDASAGSGGNGGTVSGGAGGFAGCCSGTPGDTGGNGTVWQVSPARGAGGGGGGGGAGEGDIDCLSDGGNGGDAGAYGGGAGGGGPRGSALCLAGSGGTGAQGIIVTTYTVAAVASGLPRAGLKILFNIPLKIVSGGIKILH